MTEYERLLDGLRREGVTAEALAEVLQERRRQDEKWGEQNHPDIDPDGWWYQNSTRGRVRRHADLEHYQCMANEWKAENARRVTTSGEPKDRNAAWDGILLEEVYEALSESDPAKLRAELVQVAAVAVSWIEALDRRVAQAEADLAASPWPGTGST